VRAAVDARVGLIVYTSFVNTDTSDLVLAEEHKQTEALIRQSGLPYVLLRNGAYIEMYTETLAPALQFGAIMGAAGDGKVSGATRADLAAAAAVVLTSDGHTGKVYELGGRPFTMADLATGRCRRRPASRSSTRAPSRSWRTAGGAGTNARP
jgi:NAD(P)H dehydrogenase (quinone)